MLKTSPLGLIDSSVLENAKALAHQFENGRPFRHVVIPGFLRTGLSERLLADFPSF